MFSWPAFATPQPLDGDRSWTATFASYDQYREWCFYLVRIVDAAGRVAEAEVQVGTEFAGDDWTTPAFRNELRERIASEVVDLLAR